MTNKQFIKRLQQEKNPLVYLYNNTSGWGARNRLGYYIVENINCWSNGCDIWFNRPFYKDLRFISMRGIEEDGVFKLTDYFILV